MNKYDVIVVGGRCAGAAAGILLAGAGRNTAIIDQAAFPSSKLCGGMVTEKTVRLLKEIYGEFTLAEIIDSSYNTFGIYHKDLGRVCHIQGTKERLYLVDRTVFDHFFLTQAKKAGCTVFEGDKVVKATPGSVVTASGKELESSFIIGADGARSAVRPLVTNHFRKEHFMLGLEIHVPRERVTCYTPGESVDPRIYFGFIEHGYAWVFPWKRSVVIGLGGMIRKNEKGLKELFTAFLGHVTDSGEILAKQTGSWSIPLHNYISTPAKGGVLLTGDAAGFVEPLTGEGIYFAALSGKLAASAIINGNPADHAYNRAVKREIHPLFRQSFVVRSLFFRESLLRLAMDKFTGNGKWGTYYWQLMSGEYDYLTFFKKVLLDRGHYPVA